MKVKRMPMSACSLIGEQAQVTTAAASVQPTSTTTCPVNRSDLPYASRSGSPALWCGSWTDRR